MWIFSKDVFLSIVEDADQPTWLLVRARVKGDIEKVFPDAIVKRTPNADYRFRTTLDRDTVANAVNDAILDIDYGNFKNAVTDKRRKVPYTRVWFEMSEMQEKLNPREIPRFNLANQVKTLGADSLLPPKRGNPRKPKRSKRA